MKSSLLNSSTNGASTSGRRQCFAGNVRRISPLGPLGSSWLVAGGGLAHERRGRQEDAAKTHMWPFDQAWGPSLDTTVSLHISLFHYSAWMAVVVGYL